MITFEQPLNQRIRVFMRVQQLAARFDHHANADCAWDIHTAVLLLIDLHDIADRTDLKVEAMKELERQSQSLSQFSGSCAIDDHCLNEMLERQRACITQLHEHNGQMAQTVKRSAFLNNVRQRCAVSGSPCSSDLPVYYHWLNASIDQCKTKLQEWMKPYRVALKAIDLALSTIRNSTYFEALEASDGFYPLTLNPKRLVQLIRVKTPGNIFPQISGNKYLVSLQFFRYTSTSQESLQAIENIKFELAVCTI